MKKSDLDGTKGFDFLDLFSSASPSEIEAVCLYEYMRESQGLRDVLNVRGKSDQELQAPFYPNVMFARVLLNIRRLGKFHAAISLSSKFDAFAARRLVLRSTEGWFSQALDTAYDAFKTQLTSLLGGATKSRFRGDKD